MTHLPGATNGQLTEGVKEIANDNKGGK